MRCTIWYHLSNLKNVKNAHGGVLILVKLQAEAKINTPSWVFFTFFKLDKWYQIAQRTTCKFFVCILSHRKKGLQPAYFRKEFPYGRLKTQVAITDKPKKIVEAENALLEEEYVIGEAQGNRNKLNYQGRNYGKDEVNSNEGDSKIFASSKYRSVYERGRENMVNPIHSKFVVEKEIVDSNITSNKHMVSTSEKSKLSLVQLLVFLGGLEQGHLTVIAKEVRGYYKWGN